MPLHEPRLASYLAACLSLLCTLAWGFAASATAAPPVPGARDPASRSPGCGRPAPRTGLLTLKTTDGNEQVRTYLLQVPADYSAARSYPVIFVFHGSNGTGRNAHDWGLQDAVGAAQNGIFAFPDGIKFHDDGVGWDDSNDGRDMALFDHMVDDLGATYCIDTGRLFIAGFSWGADFAIALACNRGDRIRALVANSADDEYRDKTNYLTYNDLPCPAHRHPPIRFGHAVGGDKSYPAPLFATTSKLLAYFNSCGPDSTPVSRSAQMSCVAHTACASEYVECAFDPRLGHALPPAWAQDTWDFFAKF